MRWITVVGQLVPICTSRPKLRGGAASRWPIRIPWEPRSCHALAPSHRIIREISVRQCPSDLRVETRDNRGDGRHGDGRWDASTSSVLGDVGCLIRLPGRSGRAEAQLHHAMCRGTFEDLRREACRCSGRLPSPRSCWRSRAAPVHVTIRGAVACRSQPAELVGLADEERGVLALQRCANRIAPDGADTA